MAYSRLGAPAASEARPEETGGDKSDDMNVPGTCIISEQRGSTIEKREDDILPHYYGCTVAILKHGWRVSRAEAAAMKLVKAHTDIPSPHVLDTYFHGSIQQIMMTFIPGQPLEKVWLGLKSHIKERVCQDLWVIIQKIRHIPRPPELEGGPYLCLADGSLPLDDPLIQDITNTCQPITSDDDVRARIYENYYASGGRKYEKVLPDMLPRSWKSVFTHADIAPRNIMVDDDYYITGLLDWEMAGWFPDYWELVNITAPKGQCGDWQQVMVDTAPKEFHCDLQGIKAARAVLF